MLCGHVYVLESMRVLLCYNCICMCMFKDIFFWSKCEVSHTMRGYFFLLLQGVNRFL